MQSYIAFAEVVEVGAFSEEEPASRKRFYPSFVALRPLPFILPAQQATRGTSTKLI